MATDLKAAPKHELFVEQQLDRVSKRLHALDLGRLGLLLLALVMAHALGMALIDLAAGPKAGSWAFAFRLSVWGVSLAAALVLGTLFLMRLFSKINPYYAAKQIEETIPDAKNSVVNWLDLREQPLAPVIKTALGLRAAKDLKSTDPDRSIHAKKNTWLLALGIGALLLALLALLVAEPGRFGSLMQRAFLPLGEITLGTRTRITLVQPAKGDLTVTPDQRIVFEVKIGGVVPRINSPQEARLLFRYQADQTWASIPLEEERDGSWTAVMQSDRVQNGFTYKIAANDAETPEYQVTVQSLPGYANAAGKPFEVDYHYPPYMHLADRKVTFPNDDRVFPEIKGPAGTEVTFTVRTNRDLHNARLELNYPNSMREISGTVLADDPKAFQAKFTLETSGQFHVRFITQTGEANSDNAPYNLLVVPDQSPFVVLRQPGKDIELPANGTLALEGLISDDFGIKHVVLRLEVVRRFVKTTLAPKVYRPEKSLRFEDGSFADRLDYRDFVVLSQLKDLLGEQIPLMKGDVLYYWLEATDNCDFPEGKVNVGHSKMFKVNIIDPQDAEKQRAEERQAEREQKNHEKRQDEDLRQQEIDRRQKQQEQNRPDNQDPARAAEQQKRENDVLNRLKEQVQKDQQAQGADSQPSENGAPNQKTDQTAQGQKKELSEKDVDRLKEMLKQEGAVSELAQRELKNAADKAKNEDVRQAAREALKNRPAQPPHEPTPQDIDKLKEMLKDQGQLGSSAAQELAKALKDSKNPAIKKAAEEALKHAKPGQLDPSQKKELTEKDLAQLKEMLKDPALKDLAQRELKNAAEKAGKEEIQQAAQDALKNADNQPSRQLSPKDIDELKKILEDKGPLGDAARKELAKAAESATDPAARQAAVEALKKDQGNEPRNPSPPKSEPTQEDIAKFKEILKDKGPLGDFARQQLKNALQKANDPAVRKAAEEALKNQGGKGEPSAKDIEEFKEMLKDKGQLGDMLREELSKMAQQSKDDATRQALQEALKNSPPTPGNQPKKDLTEKDIAQLKDLLPKEGPVGDFARQQLEKAASDAKNDAARTAAREALKQDQAGKEPTAKDIARLKDLVKEKGSVGDAAAGELAKIAQNGKDDATRQAAKDALKAEGRENVLQPTKPAPTGQANAPKADPSRDVTFKEIDALEKLANKQGLVGDLATRELAEAKRLAKDPKVRQAAEEALKRLAGQPGVEPNQDDVALLREMLKDKGQLGDAAQRELSRLAADAKNAEVRDAAANALKEAQRKPSSHDPFRDASRKDVAEMKKNLNKEGLQGDIAAENLAEIARSAKDEKVRKEAQEALKSRDPLKTEPATPEDVAQLKRLLDDKGPLGDAAAREMARLAQEGLNPEARAAAGEALKASNRDPVTLQRKEPLRPNPADPEASRRGGDLTLEELKNKVTPEMLKKLGITPEEFSRILKNQEDRQRAKEDPLAQRGDPSLLPGAAPRLADPNTSDNASSIQGNRGQPPPGFRDIYNRWTTRRTNPDGK